MLKGHKGFRSLGAVLGLSILSLGILAEVGLVGADAAVDDEAQHPQARQDLMAAQEAVSEFLRTVESFNERRLALQARQRAFNIGIDQDAGGADRDPWEVSAIWSAIGGLLDQDAELEQNVLDTPAPNEQATQVIEFYSLAVAQERLLLMQWREYVVYGKGELDRVLVSLQPRQAVRLHRQPDPRLVAAGAQRLARAPRSRPLAPT